MVARSTSDGELPLLLAALPPSAQQRRFAWTIIAVFLAIFAITVPFANTPLPRMDSWVPSFTTALVITDLVTAALLFSQYSIARQPGLLILATGYLFSALIIIPYALTFPGVYAPTGLLGAGLQSAVWFYIVWHIASPLSVILYELFKDTGTQSTRRPASFDIALSAVVTLSIACALVWIFTAQHDLLPRIYLDGSRLAPLAKIAAGLILLVSAGAFALLWIRGTSVLDLWLMVTVCAWGLEITLNGLMLTDRFSLGWYVGRTFALIAGSVVLIMLLSETTTLYAHLARSVMSQRAARQARHVAMDAMAASVAHELNQPLGSIVLNTESALIHLARTPPNIGEAQAALDDIATAGARGGQIIAGLRAMFRKGSHGRARFDANDLAREVLAMLDVNLRAQGVSVSTEFREGLPRLLADRVQLQQVFLNLIVNAIEAMQPVTDRQRTLRVTSDIVPGSSEIIFTVADSGVGIGAKGKEGIFEPFFTTKPAGLGIGLTICRSIIDSHGGSLRAVANSPYGTIFEVLVPAEAGVAG